MPVPLRRVAIVSVLVAAGLGGTLFLLLYSPARARDITREADLAAAARMLHARYGTHHSALPPALALGSAYEYRPGRNGDYVLCATFEEERDGATGTFAHRKGRNCFNLSVYRRPPIARGWFNFAC